MNGDAFERGISENNLKKSSFYIKKENQILK